MNKLIKLVLVVSLLLTSTLSFGEAKDLPKQVLFSNVNIFDGRSDKLQQNMHVLVSGNKIAYGQRALIGGDGQEEWMDD